EPSTELAEEDFADGHFPGPEVAQPNRCPTCRLVCPIQLTATEGHIGVRVLDDVLEAHREVRRQISLWRLLASRRDDLDDLANPERSKLSDSLATHHRATA